MSQLSATAFSILDLVSIRAGDSPAAALRESLDLARHAETLGFKRFWLAEHHNMDGVASSATAVLVGYIAAGTATIRVGSGGIMLPNHAPLIVAENFGTLATLYPGRIDLGLGRAPGADQATMRALRRDRMGSARRTAPDRDARRRHRSADLDSRLQPVRCPAGSADGLALRVRIAFCAALPASSDHALPRTIPAFRSAQKTVPDAGHSPGCSTQR